LIALSSRPGKSAGDQIKKCMVVVSCVAMLSYSVVVLLLLLSLLLLLFMLLLVHFACVRVSRCRRFRAPAHRHPHLQQKEKTRAPPLHTRYPLVSTSIEDLFYRSLVQTRSRTRSMRGQHYFRLIYRSGRFYGFAHLRARARAHARRDSPNRHADPSTRARRREECKVLGSSRISSLSRFAPLFAER